MKKRKVNNNILEICDENDNLILSIEEVLLDNVMKIILSGDIKNEVAHEVEDEIVAVLTVCRQILIDMENVKYIAAIALNALLSIQQIADEIPDANVTIIKASKEVMEIFKEAGFLDILNVEIE